jgi:hypothetical protein
MAKRFDDYGRPERHSPSGSAGGPADANEVAAVVAMLAGPAAGYVGS